MGEAKDQHRVRQRKAADRVDSENPSKVEPKAALIYLRLPSDGEARNVASSETQNQACTQMVFQMGGVVKEVFTDIADPTISLKSPGLKGLLKRLESPDRDIQLVVTSSPDRSLQSLQVFLELQRRVEAAGAELRLVNQPDDWTSLLYSWQRALDPQDVHRERQSRRSRPPRLGILEREAAEVRRFCTEHFIPQPHGFWLEAVVRGNTIEVREHRVEPDPRVEPDSGLRIAVLRFHTDAEDWSLYWLDRNDRPLPYFGSDRRYRKIESLLKQVEDDAYRCFFG